MSEALYWTIGVVLLLVIVVMLRQGMIQRVLVSWWQIICGEIGKFIEAIKYVFGGWTHD
jgi:hypothetical protein